MQSSHFTIKGKVQGVFFRARTKSKADELEIKGWVKNTDIGDVEVMAQGVLDQLAKFEDWCRKGPSRARVDFLIREDRDADPFSEFTVLR